MNNDGMLDIIFDNQKRYWDGLSTNQISHIQSDYPFFDLDTIKTMVYDGLGNSDLVKNHKFVAVKTASVQVSTDYIMRCRYKAIYPQNFGLNTYDIAEQTKLAINEYYNKIQRHANKENKDFTIGILLLAYYVTCMDKVQIYNKNPLCLYSDFYMEKYQ